jgi:hypothetical protein
MNTTRQNTRELFKNNKISGVLSPHGACKKTNQYHSMEDTKIITLRIISCHLLELNSPKKIRQLRDLFISDLLCVSMECNQYPSFHPGPVSSAIDAGGPWEHVEFSQPSEIEPGSITACVGDR